ncbi:MAG: hypothetical protein LBI27_09735 [Clostridiales bacterium]|jgi:hypothetical protein|nr:hypothetical protein [Clostridiales bacterium]
MVERDYLLRILHEFFDAIAKIIYRHTPEQESDFAEIQSRFNSMYRQFFKKNAEHFYETEKEALLNELEQEGLADDFLFAKIQMLSELLYQDALIKKDIPEQCRLLEKAIYFLVYLNQNSRTFSWEREQRMADIQKTLEEWKS